MRLIRNFGVNKYLQINHSSYLQFSIDILWKKAQKIAKKNSASEAINKATPKLRPRCTAAV